MLLGTVSHALAIGIVTMVESSQLLQAKLVVSFACVHKKCSVGGKAVA